MDEERAVYKVQCKWEKCVCGNGGCICLFLLQFYLLLLCYGSYCCCCCWCVALLIVCALSFFGARSQWQQDKWLEIPCMIVSHNKFSLLPNGFSLRKSCKTCAQIQRGTNKTRTHTLIARSQSRKNTPFRTRIARKSEWKEKWLISNFGFTLSSKPFNERLQMPEGKNGIIKMHCKRNQNTEEERDGKSARLTTSNENTLFILIPFRFDFVYDEIRVLANKQRSDRLWIDWVLCGYMNFFQDSVLMCNDSHGRICARMQLRRKSRASFALRNSHSHGRLHKLTLKN